LEEIVIDGTLDDSVLVDILRRPQFVGCQWDIVLLASARTMKLTLEAFDCLFWTYLVTSDVNTKVSQAIWDGKALFGISQQQFL
jgi:hypothetical protein